MNQSQWTAVDRYIGETLAPSDAALESALADSATAGLPPINVAPNQGKFLQILARSIGARRILEIGTLGGYSTIWMARALPDHGHLITLEIDPKHAAVAASNVARAGLTHCVEIRLGAALDSLAQLAAEAQEPFDLVFIDADKQNIPAYFKWAQRLTRTGGLIVIDNVVRDGAVIDAASDDPSVRGVRALNEMIAADPRISATSLQTVGTKGYDGFTIAYVVARS